MPRCEDGFFKWLEEIDCRDVKIYAMQEGSVSTRLLFDSSQFIISLPYSGRFPKRAFVAFGGSSCDCAIIGDNSS